MRHRRHAAMVGILSAVLVAGPANAVGPFQGGLHIHGIAVDPYDSSGLLVATHEGLFLISPDGTGISVSVGADDYVGFSVVASDPGVLLASGHASSGGDLGLLSSRDGGREWQAISREATSRPADLHALTASAAAPDTLYGLDGSIWISRDAGKTWVTTGAPPSATVDLAVSAIDPGIVFAATDDGLFVSLDEGKTWRPTAGDRGTPATMVETAPDGSVYAFIVGSGLLRTPAVALDWSPIAKDVIDNVIIHMAFDPIDPDRLFAVTQHSRILASGDRGISWTLLAGESRQDGEP